MQKYFYIFSEQLPTQSPFPARLPGSVLRTQVFDLPAQASARRIAQTLHTHTPTWRQTGTDLVTANISFSEFWQQVEFSATHFLVTHCQNSLHVQN